MSRPIETLLAVCVIALLAGCEHEAPKFPVTGKVTIDGAPLTEGSIHFKDESQGAIDIALITNGTYEVQALPGKRRVEIISEKTEMFTGESGMTTEEKTSLIPARYNTESTLTADVRADGPNQFDFEVESK